VQAQLQINSGALVPSPAGFDIIVYAAPTQEEKLEAMRLWGLDVYDVESALDPDEIPRIEYSSGRAALIWNWPRNAAVADQIRFDVASMGLFLTQGKLIIVTDDPRVPFSAKEFAGASSALDVLLRLLLHTVHHYLGHLPVIKQMTVELSSKIGASMENKYFLEMFALRESLVYYLNAIEANGAVLAKLRANAERLALPPQQVEFLHDLILDNQQCARQAQIHSSVLAGLMDARGTIINNNVNVLLKNLTLINVVFLPLTLIASIGGMSEFTMMTKEIDWRLSYSLLSIGMVLLGWITWAALVRILDKREPRRR